MTKVSSSRLETLLRGLAALAGGVLTLLAFAPFDYWALAIIGPAILFRLWNTATPRRALFYGWSYGIGLMGFGVFWLRISINQFGGVNWLLAASAALMLAAFFALLYGLAGWFATRACKHPDNVRMLLVFPALFVLSEWVRGWLLTGFPWLTLGYSQIDSPLSAVAPILGVYGVSWAVVLSAAAIVCRRAGWPMTIVIGLWLVTATTKDISWSEQDGEPINVSIIQGNVAQEDKWRTEQFRKTLALYSTLTEQTDHARLIIWPETAVPAYADQVEDALLLPMHHWLAARGQDVLMGIPVRETDGRYYNAVINIGVSGRGAYYKRHLVPFGEYVPLRRWLEPLGKMFAIPMSNFTPGEAKRPLLRSAGQWLGMSICYEDAFGNESIQAMPEASFLVNLSNDAWFGDSLAPHQHLQIARMRAVESRRYLVRATNTGISAIIDAQGQLAATAPQFEKTVLSGRVLPRSGVTPYARLGDIAALAVILLALVTGLGVNLRNARKAR